MTPKAWVIKPKVDKWDYLKLSKISIPKESQQIEKAWNRRNYLQTMHTVKD